MIKREVHTQSFAILEQIQNELLEQFQKEIEENLWEVMLNCLVLKEQDFPFSENIRTLMTALKRAGDLSCMLNEMTCFPLHHSESSDS